MKITFKLGILAPYPGRKAPSSWAVRPQWATCKDYVCVYELANVIAWSIML